MAARAPFLTQPYGAYRIQSTCYGRWGRSSRPTPPIQYSPVPRRLRPRLRHSSYATLAARWQKATSQATRLSLSIECSE